MLNLHAPFRRAASGDETGIAKLAGGAGAASIEHTVVADETGRITAVLSGAPEGETWRIAALEIAPERLRELGPRILAVADALAADEGLASVTLDASGFAQDMLQVLDQEGFRPTADGAGQGGSRTLVRPVVPQG